METLVVDYLKGTNHYLVVGGQIDIKEIEPATRYDEQHYNVTVVNRCAVAGVEFISVSVSDLLVFMYDNRNCESSK